MSKVANVVSYTVKPENADELLRRVQEHLVPAVQRAPGYQGFLLLDQGDGKRLALVLFESIEAARAAQRTVAPIGQEQTYALMSEQPTTSLGTTLIRDGLFA
jgi:heme-degrading monooxygenase HmoA